MQKIVGIIIGLIVSVPSWAGSGFSEEGNALFVELQNHLISAGLCKTKQECFRVAPIYGRDGTVIEMNLYAASPTVIHEVFGFVAENGLRISRGKAIKLNAFPKPKENYVNSIGGMLANRNPPISLQLKAQ